MCSPGTCLGIHVLFVTKRRGVLSFRKGKLGHLHIDVMVASREKRAVTMALAGDVAIIKGRHLWSFGSVY